MSYFTIWLFVELGVLALVDFLAVLDFFAGPYSLRKFLIILLKLNLGFGIGTAFSYWFCLLSYVFVIAPYIPA